MTEIDEQQDRLIGLLSPQFRIPRSASEPTGPAADELRQLIMGVPGVSPASEIDNQDVRPVTVAPRRRWWSLRRRLAIAVPAMAGLGALAVIVGGVLPESGPVGPVGRVNPVGPAPARADTLQVTPDGGYLEIRILDPVADPQRYREELARHGLDIELKLAPAAANQVGRVIFEEIDDNGSAVTIDTIEAPGDCTPTGNCSVGIRVPREYKGHAQIVFGRTPKPGEEVEGDAPVLSAEQEAALKALVGQRVSDVRWLLTTRGQTATYRVGFRSLEATADQVPGSWYVYDVAALANNVVVLWVSADGKQPRR
ncbi:hypothetical protein GA0074695_5102 [Micromonospora viridifaciens]|uniref:Uncharacterized protein n=1 Tax=Micromonospora viridifaciens TaxID=1881 RepID=A0A1C4Z4W2_MICVI|nr:hypothetical protein [Micromonospora viridifaciens]SCF27973.1 hypothetical protein GA0074695_5102 [Micromonospora viridifaciens]